MEKRGKKKKKIERLTKLMKVGEIGLKINRSFVEFFVLATWLINLHSEGHVIYMVL